MMRRDRVLLTSASLLYKTTLFPFFWFQSLILKCSVFVTKQSGSPLCLLLSSAAPAAPKAPHISISGH